MDDFLCFLYDKLSFLACPSIDFFGVPNYVSFNQVLDVLNFYAREKKLSVDKERISLLQKQLYPRTIDFLLESVDVIERAGLSFNCIDVCSGLLLEAYNYAEIINCSSLIAPVLFFKYVSWADWVMRVFPEREDYAKRLVDAARVRYY